MKAKIILIALISFLTVTCTNISQTKEEIVEIDILDGFSNIKDFNLSEIAKDVSYIKLENHPNAQFSLGLPILHNDYILIKAFDDHRLILFDSDGSFIRNIGNYGRGPGEFMDFQDVYFHPNEPKILVNDIRSRKLLIYTLEGECLEDFNYSSLYRKPLQKAFFNKDGTITVVLRRPMEPAVDMPLLRILDDNFQESKLYHYISHDAAPEGGRSGFSNYWIDNGQFYMHEFFYDKVHTMLDDNFLTICHFVISKNNAPTYYIPRNPGVWAYNSIPYVRSVGKYFLLYIHLPNIEGRHDLLVFDSESTELFKPTTPKTINYDEDMPGINNDIDGYGQIIVIDTWDGKIADILNVIDLQETLEQEKLEIKITHPKKREQLIDLVKEMNPEDSPIVRVFTLR